MKTKKRRQRSNKNRIALENRRFTGAHEGRHGFDCAECARHMMEQIADDKQILDAGGQVVLVNAYIPSLLIRQALGFFDNDNFVLATDYAHGEVLCDQDIERLLFEHRDLFDFFEYAA